jgi:flavorubredoxin
MLGINKSLLLENKNLSTFEITKNFTCIRFIDQNKERFELEFNLEKGTSFNTFLIRNNEELFIIHPPEKQHLSSFIDLISNFFNQFKLIKIKN